MTLSRSTRLFDALAHFLMVGGLIAACVAPLVLAVETFEWATNSEWPGLTVADGLSLFGLERADPETESQRLTDMLRAVPLTIALFVAGICMFLSGVNFGDGSGTRDLEAQFLSDD